MRNHVDYSAFVIYLYVLIEQRQKEAVFSSLKGSCLIAQDYLG